MSLNILRLITFLGILLALEEIRSAQIGSYIGDAIVKYLEDRNYKVDAARSDELNLDKLISRHIDFWATGNLIGQYILKKNKIKGIIPILTFNQSAMYLGCNKKVPNQVITKLNQTLKQMYAENEIEKIYKRYGYVTR